MILRRGENSIHNWTLFDEADPEDWWFHFDSFPGPHYYISELDDDDDLYETVIDVCSQMKLRSKYKHKPKVKCIYTQRKNLIKGDFEGEIGIKNKKKCNYVYI